MSFANVGLIGSLVGLAALAAVFFVLQRLRVRHRPVVVETALFWRQAVEESRARVFVERFRHPWTYVLLLAIASLLWLGFAGPRLAHAGDRDHLVLLDGSAAMARGDRFAAAAAAAAAYAAELPVGHRTVVLCGGRAETVLRPGEELVLLEQRLAERAPAACPATVAATLRAAARHSGARPLDVVVVGDAPVFPADLAGLPASCSVRRLPLGDAPSPANRGIVALGVRAAASGRWDAVDVLVEVAAANGADAPAPELRLDGEVAAVDAVAEPGAAGARYRYADLPAHGGVLGVALPGEDGLPLDDRARFALPDRRPLRVAVEPGVPDVLRAAIEADPGLAVDDADPAVVVRRGGSAFGDGLPSIELVGADAAEDAFLVVHPADLDPAAVLRELYDGLGLAEIDAMSLAQRSGRTISMGAAPGPVRQLWVWQELLRDDFDFVDSRAFPLFFGLGLRWLADFDEGPARVAVGEPLPVRGERVTRPDGRTVQALSATFVPGMPGEHTSDRGERLTASLLDPTATTGAAAGAVALPEAPAAAGAGLDLVTLLLGAALALLVVEWWLYRKGAIA